MPRLLAVTLIMVVMCLVVRGQEKAKLPGEDWIRLFNGNDLSGWTKIGNESWTVEDGLIHGKGLTKDYGYLQTEKDYKDFQLSLRFKCVGDGNSGVFFHSAFKPGTADVTQGMQFEIDCTMMHHTAGVYAEDGRGWVVWPAPENEGVVRMGEWNDYLVEVDRKPLPIPPERRAHGGLHRSQANLLRWQDRIATARRRTRQHGIQRHLDTRSFSPLAHFC